MTTASATRRRPPLVTIVVVLVYFAGFLAIGLGLAILLSRYQQTSVDDVVAVSLIGAGVILFGLLIIAIASALSRGSRFARIMVTIYLALLIGLQVVTIVTEDAWDVSSVVQIAVEAAVLVIVWAPPGSRWFRPPDAAREEPRAPGR